MEETLQAYTVNALERESQLSKLTEERDRHAQREREATDALEKEREARLKVEHERNEMASKLSEAKATLAEFVAAVGRNASLESFSSGGLHIVPYLLPTFTTPEKERPKATVFGSGTSANLPGSPPRTPVKSPSRFGTPTKAAGGHVPT